MVVMLSWGLENYGKQAQYQVFTKARLNRLLSFCVSIAVAPTSFEGTYGKIIYRVRAFVDTPRFAKDFKTEKPFYLLTLLNLNDVPEIRVSREHSPGFTAV